MATYMDGQVFLPFCGPLLLLFSWLPLVVWLLQVLEPLQVPLVSVLLLFSVSPLPLLFLYELLPQPVINRTPSIRLKTHSVTQ